MKLAVSITIALFAISSCGGEDTRTGLLCTAEYRAAQAGEGQQFDPADCNED